MSIPKAYRAFKGTAWTATMLMAGATVARAHHVMDGEVPRTFVQGLLSGLGHPVIGPDHLAFVVAIGIIAAMAGRGLPLIAAFIVSSMAGVAAHHEGLEVPAGEMLVAASLIAAGGLIWASRARAGWIWANLAVAAGLVHGYAYGGSIVGAEPAQLGAYLVGLAAIQAVIAAAAMVTARRFESVPGFSEAWLPRAGLVLAAMGTALLVLGIPVG